MNSTNCDEDIPMGTPPELAAEANLARANLLPPKSEEKYLRTFENFKSWQKKKNTSSLSENVILAYFNELAKDKKPSTLWAMYSMLKSTIQLKYDINIKNYAGLMSFLKRKSSGFKSKKSKILTNEDITIFLNEAPDEIFLATKVALILGVNGACRMIELTNLTVNDITCHDDILLVKLRETKTKIDRMFVIPNEFVPVVKKYQTLRPKSTNSDRFFINYKNGKCVNQVIGRHAMAKMPTQIASYLKLADSECYTGHCFRRSSATLLADSGANLTTIKKRHGGWKSDAVAESYIEESVQNKRNISEKINQTITLQTESQPSTSNHQCNKISSPKPSTSRIDSAPLSPNPHIDFAPLPPNPQHSNTQSTTTSNQENIQTNISVPGKNITLSFTNCPNMNNVSITFN